ncbi:helix-turn-helix domain-containing protein [Streptomyces sp. NRRL WC-3618]|uniref:helix-turn-helix domain-containing protein n=1 Tax=Streptomyces sp. NRRL WC-3618 TaxID=1519490 RepID=UPI000B0F554D|nr:helix-turn-helix transcriptional regulator [Streptomyces sp. NRRL WC-3618]
MGSNGEVSKERKLVGELLRISRGRLELTQKQAADVLLVAESTYGSYERCERIPPIDFLRDADRGLDARGAIIACIEMMEEEKYPPEFVSWVRMERKALMISAYENMLIPGLLQTPAHAQALYEARRPAYTEGEIEKLVTARLERQEVLTRNPPPFVGYVIEESVLERNLGSDEVLKEQLLYILECIGKMRQHLTVQVMPTRRHTHAGLNGPMQLMSTDEGKNLVYVEAHGGSRLIHKSEQVIDLFEKFGILRAQALTPWESEELIQQKAGEL